MRKGWVVSVTPRPHFTPGEDSEPILQEAGWAPGPVWTGGKSPPHQDSILDRPARCSVAIPTQLRGPHRIEYYYHYSIMNYLNGSICVVISGTVHISGKWRSYLERHKENRWKKLHCKLLFMQTTDVSASCYGRGGSCKTRYSLTGRELSPVKYSRINSTQSPASGAGNVSESNADVTCRENARSRVRVDQCVSAYVAAVNTWLKWEDRTVYETCAEGYQGKWQGLCGYNNLILSAG